MGFCSNCGTEMKDGAVFCSQCGTKVAEDILQKELSHVPDTTKPIPNIDTYYTEGDNKKSHNKMIGMAVVGVVVLLGLFLLVKLFGLVTTPGYERPVKYMVAGMEDGKFRTMMKAFPDYITDDIEHMMDSFYDGDPDDFMDEMLGSLETMYGKKVKISYDIKDKEKLSKAEIKELEEDIDDMYDEDVNIKSAYQLKIKMKIKGSKESDENTDSLTVIRIGSKWYLSDFNLY